MSLGLLTNGWLSPLGGGVVSGGPSGVVVGFELRDGDGVLTAGIDLSTAGVTRVSTDGGVTFNNRAGAAPASSEHGFYTYTADTTEVTGIPYIILQINKTGYGLVFERADVTDPNLTAAVIDIKNSIIAGIDSANSTTLGAVTTINTNTNTKTAGVTSDVDAHLDATIAAAIVTVDAHTDAVRVLIAADTLAMLATAEGVIAADADVETAAIIAAIDAHTDAAVVLVNAHTDEVASGLAGRTELAAVATSIDALPAAVVSELMAFHHDGDVTFEGLCKRLEALCGGAADNLNGDGLVTFYMRDGVTIAMQLTQNVGAGTRGTASVTGSEP